MPKQRKSRRQRATLDQWIRPAQPAPIEPFDPMDPLIALSIVSHHLNAQVCQNNVRNARTNEANARAYELLCQATPAHFTSMAIALSEVRKAITDGYSGTDVRIATDHIPVVIELLNQRGFLCTTQSDTPGYIGIFDPKLDDSAPPRFPELVTYYQPRALH